MGDQQTEEWFSARIGKVTASRVTDVIAKTKTGYGASRANYMAQLVCERMTGKREEGYTNAAMQWGTDMEPEARAMYEFTTGNVVTEVGFVNHPWIDASGASPDGLVGDLGLIEVKCPNTATHIETLLTGVIPDKYQVQMMWQMICTDRMWCDFVSYDPRMPQKLQLFIKRFDYNEDRSVELCQEVETFLSELATKVAALEALQDA